MLVVWLAVWHWQTAADVFPDERLKVGEAERSFRLVVPRRLQNPAPLVFAFHGMGDTAAGMASYSKLDRLAARQGFVLVYPEARKGMWATMEIGEVALEDNPDLQYFDRLLEVLGERFDLDQRRTYVIGMSNGASFAQLLAAARPDKIAAAAAHSGPNPGELLPPGEGPPLLLLVGEDDFACSVMRADAERYRDCGRAAEFESIPGWGHQWSTAHNSRIWAFLSQSRRSE